jgi:hypothetical protein
MATDIRQIVTLFVFFAGVALCVWRWPQADRGHVVLCIIAAALWSSLPTFEPSTRTPGFGFIVLYFLLIALSRPFRRRFDVEH